MAKESEYSKKLRDPRWQKTRLQVLDRDEWACRQCFDSKSTLHVHHLAYERGKEPWDYPLGNFLTLCEDCHNDETASRRAAEYRLLQAIRRAGFFATDVEELADGFEAFKMMHVTDVVSQAYSMALASPDIQASLIEMFFNRPHGEPPAGEDA